MKNVHIYKRLKYIDVIYDYIKILYQRNLIKLNYVSNKNIIIDDFTKLLSNDKFKKFITQLKLRKLKINENKSMKLNKSNRNILISLLSSENVENTIIWKIQKF